MSRTTRKTADSAPLDKYGGSIATVLGIGAAIWALFRVGFTVRDGVEKLRNGRRQTQNVKRKT